MSNEKKLLREVTQNPTDDEPRLVLADYYQENGNPRGDLIRTQCEMETLDWDDPRYIELEDLEEKLILKHRAKWLKELPKLKGVAWGAQDSCLAESIWDDGREYFRRGFVELVSVKDYKSYQTNLAALKKHALGGFLLPLDRNHRCYKLLQKQNYVRGTTFFQRPIDIDLLANLNRPEDFQALSANECDIDEHGISMMKELDYPNLRSLDVHFNRLGDCLPELFSWSGCKNLRWLNLGLNSIGGNIREVNFESIRAFSTKALDNLFGLNLWANHLKSQHIKSLAKTPAINRLVYLSLARNEIQDAGVKALLKGKSDSLRFLNLSRTDIGDEAIVQLASSKKMAQLKRLDIARNARISVQGFQAIADSLCLSNLTHLNLPRTNFDEASAQALIDSETLMSIRYLNIGEPELKPAIIKALQKRFPRAVVKKPYS